MDRERRQRSHCLFYINVISKVIIEERVNEFTFGWQWGKPLGGLKKSVHDATCVVFAQQTTDPNEVDALNRLIDYWNLRDNLNITNDPCIQNAAWANKQANPRVACDCSNNTCHITHLKIHALDISGELPSELFVLKELMNLDFGKNVLNGAIPAEIERLSNMQHLDFGSNNFIGPLPTSLGKLTSLQELYINSSGVSGRIPQEFANLKSLRTLWASDNLFTGKLPDFFGTLTKLRNLRLQGTLLEGPIPSSFSALKKLGDLTRMFSEKCRYTSSSGMFADPHDFEKLSTLGTNSRPTGKLLPVARTGFEFQQINRSNSRLISRFSFITISVSSILYHFGLRFIMMGSVKLILVHQNHSTFIPMMNHVQLVYLVLLEEVLAIYVRYLGSNNLNGQLPANIIGPNLIAIDVSFNPLSGNLPQNSMRVGLSMNAVGTSINANNLQGASKLISSAATKFHQKHFSVKCGGTDQTSASGIEYEGDLESMGAASLYTSSDNLWAVSNTGNFISNPNGQQYLTQTGSQITGTLDSELYKTARISPSSLRYYGLGLQNGRYSVELHFAEIGMDDSHSWKGLGRRLFDVYIQGEIVLKDFNIKNEAGGSKKALIKTFEANVTNTIMDIHFFWAGKGTCCIPYQGTYGPLVSAIHVSQVSDGAGSSKKDKKRVGKLVGISMACVAGLVIISSVFYLWWIKEDSSQHMRIYTGHPGND
ncbi:LRR receptor-like serine/threonine-protein kinase [Populus alba x Populus x berolinensis]|nr:LRR receptor-like serine/threonine-protein kinase [Populus alba x Populus x berolinensis]